jgi:hypothetical protein
MRKNPKKTVANDPGREVNSLRSRYSVRPLEYLLEILNDDRLPRQLRDAAAVAALPFLHQKLKPIASDDLEAPEEQGPDLSRLTDEELEQLEQILAKAKRS